MNPTRNAVIYNPLECIPLKYSVYVYHKARLLRHDAWLSDTWNLFSVLTRFILHTAPILEMIKTVIAILREIFHNTHDIARFNNS